MFGFSWQPVHGHSNGKTIKGALMEMNPSRGHQSESWATLLICHGFYVRCPSWPNPPYSSRLETSTTTHRFLVIRVAPSKLVFLLRRVNKNLSFNKEMFVLKRLRQKVLLRPVWVLYNGVSLPLCAHVILDQAEKTWTVLRTCDHSFNKLKIFILLLEICQAT